MGPSLVELYNKALSHIAQRAIASVSDGTLQQKVMSRIWPTSRRDVLGGNNWGCSTAIENLNLLATYTPPVGWQYGYAYPDKSLALWKVYDTVLLTGILPVDNDFYWPSTMFPQYADAVKKSKSGVNFRVIYDATLNAKVVLSNTQDAIAEYSYDLEDPTLYNPSLVNTISLRLAADAAPSLTGDAAIVDSVIKKYNIAMSEAQRSVSYEQNANAQGDPGIIDSRG